MVGPNLQMPPGGKLMDLSGAIMARGLIDTHAHIFEHVSSNFGLNAQLICVRGSGTTIVDQGGPSPWTFNGFRQFIVKLSQSRVLCFISSYLTDGLLGHHASTCMDLAASTSPPSARLFGKSLI